MKYLPKILLLYSLLFASGITLIGIVVSRTSVQLLMPLLFVPVVAYFLLTTLKHSDSQITEHKQKYYAPFATVFVLLLFLGLSNVQGSLAEPSSPAPVAPSSAPLIFPSQKSQNKSDHPTLSITLLDKTYTNIYESPNTASTVVAKAYNGEEFFYVSQKEDWFEVLLSDEQAGWVNKTFVTTESQ